MRLLSNFAALNSSRAARASHKSRKTNAAHHGAPLEKSRRDVATVKCAAQSRRSVEIDWLMWGAPAQLMVK